MTKQAEQLKRANDIQSDLASLVTELLKGQSQHAFSRARVKSLANAIAYHANEIAENAKK